MSTQDRPNDSVAVVAHEITVQHSGPLPTANEFAGYERACKGAAKIILNDFIQQAAHRRECEKKQIDAQIEAQHEGLRLAEKSLAGEQSLTKLAVLFGFLVMLLLICGSFFFAYIGNNAVAITLVSVPLIKLIVGIFRSPSTHDDVINNNQPNR